jgi:hypothetical protein
MNIPASDDPAFGSDILVGALESLVVSREEEALADPVAAPALKQSTRRRCMSATITFA